jgi:hypothetical protein
MVDGSAESRRHFLKKAAVVGGVAWAAPALTAVPAGAVPGSQEPCRCDASAYGLRIKIPILGIDNIYGASPPNGPGNTPHCAVVAFSQLNFNTPVPNVHLGLVVTANLVCGYSDSSCVGKATVARLDINLLSNNTLVLPSVHIFGTNNTLSTSAGVSCPCHRDNQYLLERLQAQVRVGTFNTTVNLAASNSCNFDPLAPFLPPVLPHILTLNERTCQGHRETVNALHLNVLGIVEVIAAHSTAHSNTCDCLPACS